MEVIAVQNTGNGQLVTYEKRETPTVSSEEEVEEQPARPAGQLYLTKINGRLVMARDKKDKQVNEGMDLLSHLFGGPEIVRVVKKHYKPPEQPKPQPLLLTHMTQEQPMLLNPSQMQPHILLPAMQPIQQLHQQPQQSSMPSHTLYNAQLAQLRQAITDLQANTNNTVARDNAPITSDNPSRNQTGINTYNSTCMTITKHICVNCGILRSRKYHHEHPIKPGEVPAPAFCAKCQKDATSTDSSSSSGKSRNRRKKDKKKRKNRDKKRKTKEQNIESSNEDDSDIQKSKKFVRDKGLERKQASQKKRSYRRSEYIDDFESDMESATSGIRKNGTVSRRREASPRQKSYTQTRPVWDHKDKYIRNHRRQEEKIVYVRQEREDSPSIDYRFEEERHHFPAERKTVYVRQERDQPLGIRYQSKDKQYEPSTSEPMSYHEADKNKERRDTINTQYIEVVKEPPRPRVQPASSRRNEYESIETHRLPLRKHYKNETPRRVPYERQHSLDSNDSGVSSHHHSSQRRRQERTQLRSGIFEQPPSNVIHNIHPQPGDEKVVVRETFVYVPRKSPETQDKNSLVKKSGHVDKRYQAHELAQYSRPDSRYENHVYATSSRHELHHQPGDDKEVGRETSVYRPRNSSQTRDNDIYTSKNHYGDEIHQEHHHIQKPKLISSHDYGHEFKEIHHPERSRSRNMSRESYRQDDCDVAGAEHYGSSPDLKSADHHEGYCHPPRAPSPPESSSSNSERPQPPGIYPDSVSGVSNDIIPAAYRAYDEARQRTPSRGREAVRSSSNHRQPHVREATDGGTERALIPSPALHHPGKYAISNSPENSDDDRREVEDRHIERVHERHVTFEEPSTSYEERRCREPSRSCEEDIIVVEEESSMPGHEEGEHYDRHWEESGDGGTSGGWEQHDGGGGDYWEQHDDGGGGAEWGDSGGGGEGVDGW